MLVRSMGPKMNSVASPVVSVVAVLELTEPYARETESAGKGTASNGALVSPPPLLITSSNRLPAAGL